MNIRAIRIIGIDPGLRNVGWGLIEVAGSRLVYIACGSIQTRADLSLAERLAQIHRGLTALIEAERPDEAAVEETFVNRDPQSALKLGQARGIALAAPALLGLAGRRICRQCRQEDHRRRRPRREGADRDDGENAAARLSDRLARRRRRAGGGDHPCPAPAGARARRGMIGKLKGLVDSISEDALILDVNGVGYVVAASARTLRNLPAIGEAATLHIETQVREDAIRLFGFLAEAERDWFRLLQSVQGVGAKVALAILGILSPAELDPGDRAAGQGDGGARARRRPQARRAHRRRTEGQGAGAWRRRSWRRHRRRAAAPARSAAARRTRFSRSSISAMPARRRRWRSPRASPRSAPTRRPRR